MLSLTSALNFTPTSIALASFPSTVVGVVVLGQIVTNAGRAEMVMLIDLVMVCCRLTPLSLAPESCTCTVKVLVPSPVGAPVICPVEDSVRPAGKMLPACKDQV